MLDQPNYNIELKGLSINSHFIAESEQFNVALVDSGTTFTYIPSGLFDLIDKHFEWFCDSDRANNCKGGKIDVDERSTTICFYYNEREFPEGPKKYFMSYPVLNFHVDGFEIKWYPSEYLYRDKDNQYCMAIEKYSRVNSLIFGGTFMRQNHFIFDIENNKLGIARATCNEDINLVSNEEELI